MPLNLSVTVGTKWRNTTNESEALRTVISAKGFQSNQSAPAFVLINDRKKVQTRRGPLNAGRTMCAAVGMIGYLSYCPI